MSDLYGLARLTEPDLKLVTLTEVEGSSYRLPGARLVVGPDRHWGLVSGGCLEDEIARRVRGLSTDYGRFEIDTRQYLGCDGRLTLISEPFTQELRDQLRAFQAARRHGYCLSQFETPSRLSQQVDEAAFAEALLPSKRLFLFGSNPDVEPLFQMGPLVGWETRGLELNTLKKETLDPQTACVLMNHHFGKDLELLLALWDSPVGYLGLLGSRKRRDQLLERLAFERDLESRKLFAPVGLDLGGEGAREIALEICAEILQHFRTPSQARPSVTAG